MNNSILSWRILWEFQVSILKWHISNDHVTSIPKWREKNVQIHTPNTEYILYRNVALWNHFMYLCDPSNNGEKIPSTFLLYGAGFVWVCPGLHTQTRQEFNIQHSVNGSKVFSERFENNIIIYTISCIIPYYIHSARIHTDANARHYRTLSFVRSFVKQKSQTNVHTCTPLSRNNVEHVHNVFDFCKHREICMNSSVHTRTHNVCICICISFNALLFAEIRFVLWFFYVSQMRKSYLQIFTKCSLSIIHSGIPNRLPHYCVLCIAFEFPPFCHQFTYLSADHLPFCVYVCEMPSIFVHMCRCGAFQKRLSPCRAYQTSCNTLNAHASMNCHNFSVSHTTLQVICPSENSTPLSIHTLYRPHTTFFQWYTAHLKDCIVSMQ